jgi:hypothetical protein
MLATPPPTGGDRVAWKIHLPPDVAERAKHDAIRHEGSLKRARMASSFTNNFSGPEGLLIGAALILFFIIRQFSTRPVLSLWNVAAPAALLYFGLQGLGNLDSSAWLLVGFSISLAIALGVARGLTFRVWTNDQGRALMRGGAWTLVLWIAPVAVKAALTFAEVQFGFGVAANSSAASLLPGAVTIGAQVLVVYLRAQDQRIASLRVS